MDQFRKELNEFSHVKHVIAVISGKGGVGKSLVTSLLAVEMQRRGYRTAILDADITGPSIPKSFNLHNQTYATAKGIHPAKTSTGIQVMSLNLIVENVTDPVLWRGPIINNTIQQFWTDVFWDDVDYMFVDMPPGTGDVPLTVFQSLPVEGVVVVTSPQDLVTMIVEKSVKMTNMVDVPVKGIVENMSYFVCDNCGKKHFIYGDSHIEEVAKKYNIPVTCRLPIDPKIANLVDEGKAELIDREELKVLADAISE